MNNAIQSDLFASFYLLRPVITVVIPSDKKFLCAMALAFTESFTLLSVAKLIGARLRISAKSHAGKKTLLVEL